MRKKKSRRKRNSNERVAMLQLLAAIITLLTAIIQLLKGD